MEAVIPVAGQPSNAFMFDANSQERLCTLRDFPSCADIESDLRFCVRKQALAADVFVWTSTTEREKTLCTKRMMVVGLTALFSPASICVLMRLATKPRSKE
jgi:hypothetical protein